MCRFTIEGGFGDDRGVDHPSGANLTLSLLQRARTQMSNSEAPLES